MTEVEARLKSKELEIQELKETGNEALIKAASRALYPWLHYQRVKLSDQVCVNCEKSETKELDSGKEDQLKCVCGVEPIKQVVDALEENFASGMVVSQKDGSSATPPIGQLSEGE